MYKLCFYVPSSHLEGVKSACFEAGAGRLGNYDCCAWQVPGQGQFRPLDGSKPFLGAQGRVHLEPEYKVEMLCADEYRQAVVQALRNAHPYEEPAYDVWRLETI